jgi:acyl carrier protein
VEMTMEIENRFDLTIPNDSLRGLRTVRDVVELVRTLQR